MESLKMVILGIQNPVRDLRWIILRKQRLKVINYFRKILPCRCLTEFWVHFVGNIPQKFSSRSFETLRWRSLLAKMIQCCSWPICLVWWTQHHEKLYLQIFFVHHFPQIIRPAALLKKVPITVRDLHNIFWHSSMKETDSAFLTYRTLAQFKSEFAFYSLWRKGIKEEHWREMD